MSKADDYKASLELIRKAEAYWGPRHRAMTRRAEFLLDGNHYEDDATDEEGRLSQSSEDIRWIGQETFHVHRHEVGLVTSTPTDINARPIDAESSDADFLAEKVVSILEAEHEDPAKGWEDFYDDVVSSASACAIGVGTLDVLDDERERPTVLPRFLDPRNYMRDPTVKSVHSPRCRWVLMRDSLTKEEALERGFRPSVVKDIKADGGFSAGQFDYREKETFAVARIGQGKNPEEEWLSDDEFTVYYLWERKPKDRKTRTKDSGALVEFPEDQRYMACSCGWKSDPQGAEQAYPEAGECPECGMPAERIDGEAETETVVAYPNGKLTVFAPFSGATRPLYEGDWPVPCRSYPFFELVRNRHPFKPYGASIADLNWWNQTYTDMMMRLIGERAIQSAPFWMAPQEGLVDAVGNPWRFTTDNGWAMFYEGPSMPQVNLIEGVGIPAAFSQAYQQARSALVSQTGIADFGMEPGQSRNIPASSVAMQVQQQEIPQAHYLRRFQREKARFLGILWDYLRHVDKTERPVRMRAAGIDVVRSMRPADFPNLEFYLTAAPDVTQKDRDRAQWFQELLALAQQYPPEIMDLYAQVNRVPPSLVRKLREAMASAQQNMTPPMGDPNAIPNGPPQGPPQPQAPNPGMLVEHLLSTMQPQPQG